MIKKLLIVCMVVIAVAAQAQPPGWQVNASQYNYSMTVVGMIKNDGVPVSNANSQVAAFVNGQLRGVATPVFVPALNRSVYYLLVYSNDSGGDITFKYYDADRNTVINAPQTVPFAIDGLTGNPKNPWVWSNRVTDKTADLTSYSLPAQYSSQIYSDTIVAISMPENYDLTSVITSFTTSTGAMVVMDGQEIVSGTAINYSAGVKVTVRSEDEQTAKRYTVKIPTLSLSLATGPLYDGSPPGTFVGKLTTSGFDAGVTPVYTFGNCSPGNDNAAFSIREDSVFINGMVQYDTQPEYDVCIRTTDNHGLYYEKSFHVSILDIVTHDPSDILIETLTIEEGNPSKYLISTMQVVDGDDDDTFTYRLVSGDGDTDNAQFLIGHDSLYLAYVAYYDVKKSYTFRIRVTDAKGAFYEKSFIVDVLENARAPRHLPSANYVSPNDDGINDRWIVTNVEIYQGFSLHIFDQFGNVIFRKNTDYNNEWDGKLHGKSLPDGNYYYVFRNEQKVYSGNITIVNK